MLQCSLMLSFKKSGKRHRDYHINMSKEEAQDLTGKDITIFEPLDDFIPYAHGFNVLPERMHILAKKIRLPHKDWLKIKDTRHYETYLFYENPDFNEEEWKTSLKQAGL